jgi:hypothetical protein
LGYHLMQSISGQLHPVELDPILSVQEQLSTQHFSLQSILLSRHISFCLRCKAHRPRKYR